MKLSEWVTFAGLDTMGSLGYVGEFHTLVDGHDEHKAWDILLGLSRYSALMGHLSWTSPLLALLPPPPELAVFQKLSNTLVTSERRNRERGM